jgi:hypothetical protein
MNERHFMMNEQPQSQLELSLAGSNRRPRADERKRRHSRATWWFHQMRQLVESAADWEPAPRFLPEQTWLITDARPGQNQN